MALTGVQALIVLALARVVVCSPQFGGAANANPQTAYALPEQEHRSQAAPLVADDRDDTAEKLCERVRDEAERRRSAPDRGGPNTIIATNLDQFQTFCRATKAVRKLMRLQRDNGGYLPQGCFRNNGNCLKALPSFQRKNPNGEEDRCKFRENYEEQRCVRRFQRAEQSAEAEELKNIKRAEGGRLPRSSLAPGSRGFSALDPNWSRDGVVARELERRRALAAQPIARQTPSYQPRPFMTQPRPFMTQPHPSMPTPYAYHPQSYPPRPMYQQPHIAPLPHHLAYSAPQMPYAPFRASRGPYGQIIATPHSPFAPMVAPHPMFTVPAVAASPAVAAAVQAKRQLAAQVRAFRESGQPVPHELRQQLAAAKRQVKQVKASVRQMILPSSPGAISLSPQFPSKKKTTPAMAVAILAYKAKHPNLTDKEAKAAIRGKPHLLDAARAKVRQAKQSLPRKGTPEFKSMLAQARKMGALPRNATPKQIKAALAAIALGARPVSKKAPLFRNIPGPAPTDPAGFLRWLADKYGDSLKDGGADLRRAAAEAGAHSQDTPAPSSGVEYDTGSELGKARTACSGVLKCLFAIAQIEKIDPDVEKIIPPLPPPDPNGLFVCPLSLFVRHTDAMQVTYFIFCVFFCSMVNGSGTTSRTMTALTGSMSDVGFLS